MSSANLGAFIEGYQLRDIMKSLQGLFRQHRVLILTLTVFVGAVAATLPIISRHSQERPSITNSANPAATITGAKPDRAQDAGTTSEKSLVHASLTGSAARAEEAPWRRSL